MVFPRRRFLSRLLLLIASTIDTVSLFVLAAPCTVCSSGSEIQYPDKSLSDIPGFEFLESCGAVNSIIGAITETNDSCDKIRSIGTYCGCPIQEDACYLCYTPEETITNLEQIVSSPPVDWLLPPTSCDRVQMYLHSLKSTDSICLETRARLRNECGCSSSSTPTEGASTLKPTLRPTAGSTDSTAVEETSPKCTLCPDGSKVGSPDTDIGFLLPPDFDIPDGAPATCGMAELYVAFSFQLHSSDCEMAQHLQGICGCTAVVPPNVPTSSPSIRQVNSTTTPLNQTTDSVTKDAGSKCTLCPDGSKVGSPNTDIGFMLPPDFDVPDGVSPTCGMAELYTADSFLPGSSDCQMAQKLQGACGCPASTGSCDFCPEDSFIPYPNTTVKFPPFLQEKLGGASFDGITCQQMSVIARGMPVESVECRLSRYANHVCGCNNGEPSYFLANTRAKRAALTWVPRVTAIMSLVCSSLIILDITRGQRGTFSTYHEIMLMMSAGDIISSTALAFTSLPIPEFEFGLRTPVFGAKGNDATCTTQGFFIQLGYIALFYNLALSFYYLAVIRYNFRDQRLKRLRLWFHLPPIIVGGVLAFAGLPYYQNVLYACHIAPPPLYPTYGPILGFSVVPIALVVFFATINMILVYAHVRQTRRAGDRWNISLRASSAVSSARRNARSSAAGRQENAVFWQAVTYLAAFYITWPLYMAANLAGVVDNYGFYLAAISMTPMQGIWNSLVYFRVRILSRFGGRRKNKRGSTGSEQAPRLWRRWMTSSRDSKSQQTPTRDAPQQGVAGMSPNKTPKTLALNGRVPDVFGLSTSSAPAPQVIPSGDNEASQP